MFIYIFLASLGIFWKYALNMLSYIYTGAISEKSVLFIINGRVTSCMRKDGIRCRCTWKSSGCHGYPSTVGFSDVWDRVHWIIDILLKSISQISLNVIDEEWKLLHDHPWMNLRQYSMGGKNSNNAFKGFDRKAIH